MIAGFTRLAGCLYIYYVHVMNIMHVFIVYAGPGDFSTGTGSLLSLLNIYIISGAALMCVLITVSIVTVLILLKSKRNAQRKLNSLQAPPNHIYEDLGEIQEIAASDIDKNIAYVSVSVPCSSDNN